MINEIELSDEQLAQVTGGSTTTTNFSQFAANFGVQNTLIDGSTHATATSSGKGSQSTALAAGATINAGNSFTGVNVQSLS
jgi:bacteriocin-like protein